MRMCFGVFYIRVKMLIGFRYRSFLEGEGLLFLYINLSEGLLFLLEGLYGNLVIIWKYYLFMNFL